MAKLVSRPACALVALLLLPSLLAAAERATSQKSKKAAKAEAQTVEMFAAVEALARDVPSVRVEESDGDHFDVYAPPRLERAAAISAAFLAQQLRGAASAGAAD